MGHPWREDLQEPNGDRRLSAQRRLRRQLLETTPRHGEQCQAREATPPHGDAQFVHGRSTPLPCAGSRENPGRDTQTGAPHDRRSYFYGQLVRTANGPARARGSNDSGSGAGRGANAAGSGSHRQPATGRPGSDRPARQGGAPGIRAAPDQDGSVQRQDLARRSLRPGGIRQGCRPNPLRTVPPRASASEEPRQWSAGRQGSQAARRWQQGEELRQGNHRHQDELGTGGCDTDGGLGTIGEANGSSRATERQHAASEAEGKERAKTGNPEGRAQTGDPASNPTGGGEARATVSSAGDGRESAERSSANVHADQARGAQSPPETTRGRRIRERPEQSLRAGQRLLDGTESARAGQAGTRAGPAGKRSGAAAADTRIPGPRQQLPDAADDCTTSADSSNPKGGRRSAGPGSHDKGGG